MRILPMECVQYFKYIDGEGKTRFRAFFITYDDKILPIPLNNDFFNLKNIGLFDARKHDNDIKKTLSFMVCENYSLQNTVRAFGAAEFEEYLNCDPKTSDTFIAKKLDKMLSYIDGYDAPKGYRLPKELRISEKKLLNGLKEIEEIENSNKKTTETTLEK